MSAESQRIEAMTRAVEAMADGSFEAVKIPGNGDETGRLGSALRDLCSHLERSQEQLRLLSEAHRRASSAVTLEEMLDHVYESFQSLVPYDRISVARLQDQGRAARLVWARSNRSHAATTPEFTTRLTGSSLEKLVQTGKPRVINNLVAHLEENPHSETTRSMVEQGFRSSLTCLLHCRKEGPLGLLFFSSCHPDVYREEHIEVVLKLAGEFTMVFQLGLLYQRLSESHEALGLAVHDLREPLTVIRLGTAMAAKTLEDDPVQARELLGHTTDAITALESRIDDTLEFSRLGATEPGLRRSPVVLASFLRQALDAARAQADTKEIELAVQCPEGLPEANVDPRQLFRVLENLLSNAIKFSNSGSRVVLGARRHSQGLEIYVRDQGVGIAPDDMDLLFRPFSRTRARPTAGEGSTGLGLAICARIVDAHGGEIWADSEPGQGSTFAFTLPVV